MALVLHRSDGPGIDPVHLLGEFLLLVMVVLLLLLFVLIRPRRCLSQTAALDGLNIIIGFILLGSNRELILGGSLGPGDGINARVVLSKTIDAVELIVRHVRESIVTQSVGWLGHLAVVTFNECWVKILRVKESGNIASM